MRKEIHKPEQGRLPDVLNPTPIPEIPFHQMTSLIVLDVAASASAVALVRVAWAAGAVAVTGSVDFAFDDDPVITVVTVHK